jgi:hypothetical protein
VAGGRDRDGEIERDKEEKCLILPRRNGPVGEFGELDEKWPILCEAVEKESSQGPII